MERLDFLVLLKVWRDEDCNSKDFAACKASADATATNVARQEEHVRRAQGPWRWHAPTFAVLGPWPVEGGQQDELLQHECAQSAEKRRV